MKTYVFITEEGLTYQPNSESTEPDIENCQVIGFAEGNSPEEAFNNLIAENGYLLETNFDEIMCFEHIPHFSTKIRKIVVPLTNME